MNFQSTFVDDESLVNLAAIVTEILKALNLKLEVQNDYGDFPDNPPVYRVRGEEVTGIVDQLRLKTEQLAAEKRKVAALLEYIKTM